MNNLKMMLLLLLSSTVYGQDLVGTPVQDSTTAQYFLKDWYLGLVRMQGGQVFDGVPLRYDLTRDELEFKKGTGVFRVAEGVQEFSIPSGTDLYIFRSGFPSEKGGARFYRVLYDGKTTLLKRYKSPLIVEKADATRTMEPDAKLYIVKNGQLSPVSLKDRNSFLKLLADEKNKMQYVIKEEGLEFGGENDLVKLLEEYDAYKAGRGGN